MSAMLPVALMYRAAAIAPGSAAFCPWRWSMNDESQIDDQRRDGQDQQQPAREDDEDLAVLVVAMSHQIDLIAGGARILWRRL